MHQDEILSTDSSSHIMGSIELDFLQRKYVEIYVDVESHNYMANFWNNAHLYIGIPTTLLSSVVTASAFSEIPNTTFITGSISLLVTALTALTTFLNPSEKYNNHKLSKHRLLLLRDQVILLSSTAEKNREISEDAWQKFQTTLEEVYSNKPQIPEWVRDIAIRRCKKINSLNL
jgi:hypothetical protein